VWQFQAHIRLWPYWKEDDYASTGFRGLADFATALSKVIESQARGFAHGLGKVRSIPDGINGLLSSLEKVIEQIRALISYSDGVHPAEDVVEAIVAAKMASYNEPLVASTSTRQYESATLPARQLGQQMRNVLFSEKQQRQSRYDEGLEDDGVRPRPLVPIVPAEPAAHIAREHRRATLGSAYRNTYREVPLTDSQLCIAPHYLLPQSFGLPCSLGREGEVEDEDAAGLPGLPWVSDDARGELLHCLADLQGHMATGADLERERCFGQGVRFLHQHNHNHDCTETCVKNLKKKRKSRWRNY